MPTRIYWIHEFNNAAKIGIMARPRGGEWLEEEIISFKKQGVSSIVSLLENEEVSELLLSLEEPLCNKLGIKFHSFPIKDRALPNNNSKTKEFIENIFNEIMAGMNVVIHCRMGIGRSSIIAGAVIQLSGKKTDEIISRIKMERGMSVPDTEEQLKWLKMQEKK